MSETSEMHQEATFEVMRDSPHSTILVPATEHLSIQSPPPVLRSCITFKSTVRHERSGSNMPHDTAFGATSIIKRMCSTRIACSAVAYRSQQYIFEVRDRLCRLDSP